MQALFVLLFTIFGIMAVGCAFSIFGKSYEVPDKLARFISFMCYGPAPIVLVHLNISLNSKNILWFLSTLIYWPGLGMIVGYLTWKMCPPATENHLVQPPIGKMQLGVAGLAVVLAMITMMSLPGPTINTRFPIPIVIIDNLRQIVAAKSELVLEKKVSPDYVPTEADLLLYIKPDKEGKLPHVGPERYVLNAISEEPYAIFDKDWTIYGDYEDDSDWPFGYTITNGTIYRLP